VNQVVPINITKHIKNTNDIVYSNKS